MGYRGGWGTTPNSFQYVYGEVAVCIPNFNHLGFLLLAQMQPGMEPQHARLATEHSHSALFTIREDRVITRNEARIEALLGA